jgi:ATP-dependent Lon protease
MLYMPTLLSVIEGFRTQKAMHSAHLRKSMASTAPELQLKVRKPKPVRIDVKDVEQYLGMPVYTRIRPPGGRGVVTGLAWTPLGGATLAIEAARVHTRSRGFKLTGQLGELMRESAEIAYSFVASNLERFKAIPDFQENVFVHLHVPEGATPKDDPSAGITMASALISLARNERIRRPVAMTGELMLTGRALAIGGIREKVIAARRQRIFELILPEANRRDFEELPDHVREGMAAHFVQHFRAVAEILFG